MGRHAAPGENEPEAAAQTPVPSVPLVRAPAPPLVFADAVESLRPPGSRPQPLPRGRHSVPEEDEEPAAADPSYVEASGAVTDRIPQPAAAADEAGRPPPQRTRKQGATAADLHLLRTDPSLRNRVIAAVLVPFVLFFLVLALVGRLGTFAVWIWLPLITAGLGAGVLLDSGHARAKAAGPRTADPGSR